MPEIAERADPPRLRIGEVAELLGVSEETVRRLVAAGSLVAVRYSERGHLRFREGDVDRLLEQAEEQAAA